MFQESLLGIFSSLDVAALNYSKILIVKQYDEDRDFGEEKQETRKCRNLL